MIKNIDNKLQILGVIVMWGGILASIAIFIWIQNELSFYRDYYALYYDEIMIYSKVALAVLIAGPLSSIATGFCLVGFGKLIENTMPKKADSVEPKA